jgi:hypothetical protein
MAKGNTSEYGKIKNSLPPWIIFYNVAAYDYLTEERIKWQVADIKDLSQRIGLEPAQSLGTVSAFDVLKTVQGPSGDFYWKTPAGWACHDIFFITSLPRLGHCIDEMMALAGFVGYTTANLGVYVQPVVQGVKYHVEFNLFYNPADAVETATVAALKKVKSILDPDNIMNPGKLCF